MDENRFIGEATRCLYSSLNIEKALYETFCLLQNFFPADLAQMFVGDISRRTVRYLAVATKKNGYLIDELAHVSSRAMDEISINNPNNIRIYSRSKSFFLQEIFSHFQLSPRDPFFGENEEFSAIAIPFDIGYPLVGGFGIVGSGENIYNNRHKRLLKLISGPLAGSVLNLLHHRDIVRQNERLRNEKRDLQKRLGHIPADKVIGAGTGLRAVMDLVRHVAPTESPVLISGETGVGKEVIANAIHHESGRSRGPFICINCGTIPDSLADSELFGHEKGAFTGAAYQRRGYFEQANGGTIFLDEIGELPLQTQVRFLRVLQSMEFQRVGGRRPVSVNVRIIAATNRNLQEMVKRGLFREDLWFRLNVFPIQIPPLRSRKEDIPAIAEYFAQIKAREMNLDLLPSISEDGMNRLVEYQWPGNIRELRNIIERALIVSKGERLTFPDLESNSEIEKPENSETPESWFQGMDEMTINHIRKALSISGNRVNGKGGAADLLKMNPSTLRGRMRKYGIKTRRMLT